MAELYSYGELPGAWLDTTPVEVIPEPDAKYPLNVCLVKGLVGGQIPDRAADADKVPEIRTLNGTGVIEAVQPYALFPYFADGPMTINLSDPITFDVIDGRIFHNGTEGVAVLAGSQFSQPQTIQYKINLNNVRNSNNRPVKFPVLQFNAVQGTVDYTMLNTVPSEPSLNVVRGPIGDSLDAIIFDEDTSELIVYLRTADGIIKEAPNRIPFNISLATTLEETAPGSKMYVPLVVDGAQIDGGSP